MNIRGFFCKTTNSRLISKSFLEKKTWIGPNPAGPIGAWALEAHPAALAHLQRKPAWRSWATARNAARRARVNAIGRGTSDRLVLVEAEQRLLVALEGLPWRDLARAWWDPGKGVGDGQIWASSGRGGVDLLVRGRSEAQASNDDGGDRNSGKQGRDLGRRRGRSGEAGIAARRPEAARAEDDELERQRHGWSSVKQRGRERLETIEGEGNTRRGAMGLYELGDGAHG